MREHLYQGKRIDNGEWVEGNLFIPDEGHDAPTQICIGTDVVWITYDIDPDTVREFTGAWEKKNGKKRKRIFEGDIVSFTDDNDKPHIGVVKWSDEDHYATGFKIWHDDESENYGTHSPFDLGWIQFRSEEFKVIGNKWDNPELLNER